MRRDKNRTFYFIETEDNSGKSVVRVGSDFAPVWGQDFDTINEALDAVKRRNSNASSFKAIRNGVVAEYGATAAV